MRSLFEPRFLAVAVLCLGLAGCGQSDADSVASDSDTDSTANVTTSATSNAASELELFPQVSLETTHGRVTLELDGQHAPETVRNFLAYVDGGHYDGTLFHQVDQGYVLLGGSFTPDLTEKPSGRPIRNEAENGLKNVQGAIAMARAADQIDSSTCQFFINLADNSDLDHQSLTPEGFGYCVFGRVVGGWDVIETIASIPVKSTDEFPSLPAETVMIRSAKRLR